MSCGGHCQTPGALGAPRCPEVRGLGCLVSFGGVSCFFEGKTKGLWVLAVASSRGVFYGFFMACL